MFENKISNVSNKEINEEERLKDEKINDMGQILLNKNNKKYNIYLLTGGNAIKSLTK